MEWFEKPSAKCPFCKGRLWTTKYVDGVRTQTPRTHCSGQIVKPMPPSTRKSK